MADSTITGLPGAPALTSTSLLPVDISGVTYSCTPAQILAASGFSLSPNISANSVAVANAFSVATGGTSKFGGTLGYTDTNILAQFVGNANGYEQIILQNTNNGVTASTDVIVSNDLGTSSTHYGDFGINSSNFTGAGSLNLPGATYLYSAGGDLVLGTTSTNSVRIVTNNSNTDAIDVSAAGAVTISPPAAVTITTTGTANLFLNSGSGGTTTLGGNANGGTVVNGSTITVSGISTSINSTTGATTISSAATGTITNMETVGTTAGGNPAAGHVGEYQSANSSTTGLTTITITQLASLNLTAGDWDVTGAVNFDNTSGNSMIVAIAGINTNNSGFGSAGTYDQYNVPATSAEFSFITMNIPVQRINVTTNTTVYLLGYVQFSAGNVIPGGLIRARRVR